MENSPFALMQSGIATPPALGPVLCVQKYREDDTSQFILRTLGPELTSSAYCATAVTNAGALECRGIALHASFEEILTVVEGDGQSLALVPNAYAGINEFYMSIKLTLIASLVLDTPLYGIAAKTEGYLNLNRPAKDKYIVSTHPAPARLISQLLPVGVPFEIITTDSTVAAAEQVADGKADMCLSNIKAITDAGLHPITAMRPITMLWSVFAPAKPI